MVAARGGRRCRLRRTAAAKENRRTCRFLGIAWLRDAPGRRRSGRGLGAGVALRLHDGRSQVARQRLAQQRHQAWPPPAPWNSPWATGRGSRHARRDPRCTARWPRCARACVDCKRPQRAAQDERAQHARKDRQHAPIQSRDGARRSAQRPRCPGRPYRPRRWCLRRGGRAHAQYLRAVLTTPSVRSMRTTAALSAPSRNSAAPNSRSTT